MEDPDEEEEEESSAYEEDSEDDEEEEVDDDDDEDFDENVSDEEVRRTPVRLHSSYHVESCSDTPLFCCRAKRVIMRTMKMTVMIGMSLIERLSWLTRNAGDRKRKKKPELAASRSLNLRNPAGIKPPVIEVRRHGLLGTY